MENAVIKDTCEKIHKAVDEKFDRDTERLNGHAGSIKTVEEALIKLTTMVDQIGKKSIFDKILIVSVFLMAVVLVAVVLGPEIAGKFVGGVVK